MSEGMAVGDDRGVAPDLALRTVGEDTNNCLAFEIWYRQRDLGDT